MIQHFINFVKTPNRFIIDVQNAIFVQFGSVLVIRNSFSSYSLLCGMFFQGCVPRQIGTLHIAMPCTAEECHKDCIIRIKQNSHLIYR